MKKLITLFALLSILLFTCCQNEKKQTEKDVDAIKELLKKYEKAAAEGDVVAYANLFTEDAVWAPPNAPVAKSKAEIQQRVQPIMQMLWAELEEPASELKVIGEFAYVWSDVTGTFIQKSDSLVIPISNTALRILRKENGEWKISHQIYNSKLPE
jgi:uncharacterized protein (TIGR02246 family)